MSQRVLITGGAGFIGFHLAKHLLKSGYNLHLVDNYARGIHDNEFEMLLAKPRVTFDIVDLLDQSAVLKLGSRFDAIFHLAAVVGVAHVIDRPYSVLRDNIQMLSNVVSLANQQKDLTRLLFASTSEVYAGTLKHFQLPIPTPEQTALAITALDQPRTSYMLSKIVGEAMCHQSGVPFTIFRPHNVYGPRMGMAHVVPEQLKNAWVAEEGDSLPVYSATHKRTFCYIDDAVVMLQKMLETDRCCMEVFNVGTQSPEVTIREVVQACIDVTGKHLLMTELPPSPGSPERRAPDMSSTRSVLNYEGRIELAEGILRTWTWYRHNVFDVEGQTAR